MSRPSKGIQRSVESIHVIRLRLVVLHAGAVMVFFLPYDPALLALAAVAYITRVFGMEAGYHRYFAHRSFKTSRWFQFLLALLATSTGQRGVLWWASYHRLHHRHADTAEDVHSPSHPSFWHAHLGWIVSRRNIDTDLSVVPDWARFAELVWLNKLNYLVPIALAVAMYALGASGLLGAHIGGFQTLVWGFFVSTLLVLHVTCIVNSFVHDARFKGRRRYETGDDTHNSALLAIPSMGASWHNNHHRYAAAARAGFHPLEIDLTYYGLRALAVLGLVWDLKAVPADVLLEGGIAPRGRAAA